MRTTHHAHSAGRPRTITRRDWLGLPAAARRTGTALLNQQCWLWGQDIRRPEGNALLEYGFACQRPPEGQRGSNAYTYALESDRRVILWSFGMLYGSPTSDGIYLARYAFAPKILPLIECAVLPWLPNQLLPARVPSVAGNQQRMRGLLAEALRWIADYEAWARATLGLGFRQRCVAAWTLGPFCIPAERMVLEWRNLARRCVGPPMIDERRYPTCPAVDRLGLRLANRESK